MNNTQRSTNTGAYPTKRDLLRELGNETGTTRRQELLKALWRLNRQVTLPVSPVSARPQVAATATPEPESRTPRSVQELGGWAKNHTNAPIANARPQNAHNRNQGLPNEKEAFVGLNQLYAIEQFSLANYLRYAKPWASAADECLAEAIRHIADRQCEFSQRVGALLIERRSHVVSDSFPFSFTAYNDLSLGYLAPRVMEDQERIVGQVRAIAHQLCADVTAFELTNEILAAEQAHLNDLRQLLGGQKSEPCRESAVAASSGRHREDATYNVATAA